MEWLYAALMIYLISATMTLAMWVAQLVHVLRGKKQQWIIQITVMLLVSSVGLVID